MVAVGDFFSCWADGDLSRVSTSGSTFKAGSFEPLGLLRLALSPDRELHCLGSEFGGNFGYSAATRIEDADAFAARLGVDFALGFDKAVAVSLCLIDGIGYACSSYTTNLWDGSGLIDTLVHVYHGSTTRTFLAG